MCARRKRKEKLMLNEKYSNGQLNFSVHFFTSVAPFNLFAQDTVRAHKAHCLIRCMRSIAVQLTFTAAPGDGIHHTLLLNMVPLMARNESLPLLFVKCQALRSAPQSGGRRSSGTD